MVLQCEMFGVLLFFKNSVEISWDQSHEVFVTVKPLYVYYEIN